MAAIRGSGNRATELRLIAILRAPRWLAGTVWQQATGTAYDTCRTARVRHDADMPLIPGPTVSLDRSALSVGRLHDDDSQVADWLAQPPEQRLAALAFLRATCNPEAYASQRLRGFPEVTRRTCVRARTRD
jgi:hypothetical protein